MIHAKYNTFTEGRLPWIRNSNDFPGQPSDEVHTFINRREAGDRDSCRLVHTLPV